MILVDLFPVAPRAQWDALERACEYLDTCRRPFSRPGLAKVSNHYAAENAIRSLLALDLIRRITPVGVGARPVFYIRADLVPPGSDGVA